MTEAPMRLDGRLALITGAGGGIGGALVAAFRAAGARVVACERTPERLAGVAADHAAAFDIAEADSCRAALVEIERTAGLPDIVVGNAGHTEADTFETLTDAIWERELAVNLSGTRNVATPFLAGMSARGSGAFVFVASVNALAHFGNPAYSAAKAGLLAYMRAVATEYGRFGIRANAICPGTVRTPIWARREAQHPGILDRIGGRLYPLGRVVEPAEVAAAAVFLASPAASAITGVALPVDAGLTAGNLPFVDEIR
jgi:NAD(P)-dependent dehydrogenase (short-subunit alcohol dehydrogenase family)